MKAERDNTRYRISIRHLPVMGSVLLASVAVAQIDGARKEIVQPIPPGASSALPEGSPGWEETRANVLRSADMPIIAVVDEWKRLQQSDGFGFSAYARFIEAHPGWPGEARMRRLAEKSIDPLSYSPSAVVTFFRQYPPQTATGHARKALALSAMGRNEEARDAARQAWRNGAMSANDETWLLTNYASALAPEDHAAHADAALWMRNPTSAERALPFMTGGARSIADARIAMQRRSADAAAKMQDAQTVGKGHAGYIADKAMWLRDTGNSLLARNILANREPLTQRSPDAEEWYEVLLTNARAAANDGQWSTAYQIASKVDDAYLPGTDVSAQSLGERDDYTSLAWLAGTVAYYQLGRPADAVGMFERYASGARSPQTISKGHYWAGRAALAAGDRTQADQYFALAAAYPDQFYGQLALERLKLPFMAPMQSADATAVTDEQRKAFASQSLVRAAKALGAAGRWQDQSFMLRAIAANTSTDIERALAHELARSLNRPDLSVMVARKARPDSSAAYELANFPTLSVPGDHQSNWTMIHAITRQESQFDKAIVSHAGARGLMQLMPGTAREQSGKIGLAYRYDALTSDTDYNIQLGSGYFQRMLSYYGGSYPLAVAAYNAGPGNVNKWIRANGDPRLAGGDILRWIEEIPIYETKNYVQRVLENAVVYDALSAQREGKAMFSRPLSRYLGKNSAG